MGPLSEDHFPGFNRIYISWVEGGRLNAMWNVDGKFKYWDRGSTFLRF